MEGLRYPLQVAAIIERLEGAGHAAYLVGGALRDALLGREAHDFDVTTSALPNEMVTLFADYPVIETGLKHGTLTVMAEGMPIEVTTFRIDGEYRDARHPDGVTFTDRVEDDLARRDFTVNAMAYNPTRGLVDAFGGREDLATGTIRAVGDPEKRFSEDALRILRAYRFVSKLDFAIEPQTLEATSTRRHGLAQISAERITAELCGLFEGRAAEKALRLMIGMDIFSSFAPDFEVDEGAVDGIDKLPPRFETRLAYFLRQDCDGGEALLSRLRLSNASRGLVRSLLDLRRVNLFPVTEAKTRRLLAAAGSHADEAEALVGAGGFFDLSPEQASLLLAGMARARGRGDCLTVSSLAVDGKTLLAEGLRGREVGRVLSALLERVLDDPTLNTPETLLALARRLKNGEETNGKF